MQLRKGHRHALRFAVISAATACAVWWLPADPTGPPAPVRLGKPIPYDDEPAESSSLRSSHNFDIIPAGAATQAAKSRQSTHQPTASESPSLLSRMQQAVASRDWSFPRRKVSPFQKGATGAEVAGSHDPFGRSSAEQTVYPGEAIVAAPVEDSADGDFAVIEQGLVRRTAGDEIPAPPSINPFAPSLPSGSGNISGEAPGEQSRPLLGNENLPDFELSTRESTRVLAPDLGAYAPPYLPANSDPDALPWLDAFHNRAETAPQFEAADAAWNVPGKIPPGFRPWWDQLIRKQLRDAQQVVPAEVDQLTISALEHSPQVRALQVEPQIRGTYFCEEAGVFDWRAFWETKWSDLNDPVGNTLTTGGPERFKDRIWSGSAGLRNRNQLGGEFEFSQKFGFEDQNSLFFIPANQGTARLQLSYTQPLLNGAGRAYNQSRLLLAQIDSDRSFDEVSAELQTHLYKVTEAYWELYRVRAMYLQRQKLLLAAEDILETIHGRQEVDAMQRQLLRVQAAVASRRAEIVRTAAAIRNAEARLRLLVQDPRLLELADVEVIPLESPRRDYIPISLTASLQSALMNRPDISQAIRDLRAAGIRIGMAENEMLPKLDLVLQTYVAGLAGGGNIASGFGKQWSDGRPGYTAGLRFDVPLGNRAARARLERQTLELNRTALLFQTTVETGLTEVELAVRESETAYREMAGRYQSLLAAEIETSFLTERWRWLPGDDRSTAQLLEDLLESQERLATAEAELVTAEAAYVVGMTRVRKAMGTLLQAEYLPFEMEGTPVTTPAHERR